MSNDLTNQGETPFMDLKEAVPLLDNSGKVDGTPLNKSSNR